MVAIPKTKIPYYIEPEIHAGRNLIWVNDKAKLQAKTSRYIAIIKAIGVPLQMHAWILLAKLLE